jgi:hypothetical protein
MEARAAKLGSWGRFGGLPSEELVVGREKESMGGSMER